MDTMNFDCVKGRPVRIMWSQRDPSIRRSGVGNVFIKNLDKSIDNKALFDTFSAFGNILSCKIASNEYGSRGYGYVHFELEEAARQAIGNVNGMLLNGKKVFVGRFIPRKERLVTQGDKSRKFNNVYIKNFGTDLDDEKLRNLFEPFGAIISAKVMEDEQGVSKGFGFVSFEENESAEKAVMSVNAMKLNGKEIYVGQAQKKSERSAELRDYFGKLKVESADNTHGVNLYVKNLDESVNEERLQGEFGQFGTITSCKVMMENGHSKGFGFVCFSSPNDASRAISEMNGRLMVQKPLYVALAQRKEDRRSFFASRSNVTRQPSQAFNNAFFRSTGAGYFIPTVPQAQRGYFAPAQLQHVRGGVQYWPSQRPGSHYLPSDAGSFAKLDVANPHRYESVAGAGRAIIGQAGGQRIGEHLQSLLPLPLNDVVSGGRQARLAYNLAPHVGNQRSTHVHGSLSQMSSTNQENRITYRESQYAVPMVVVPPAVSTSKLTTVETLVQGREQKPLTATQLASVSPTEQKQLLGERLFTMIHRITPSLAGKVTGMLLEIDNSELLHMLESQESLKAKVDEAVAVFQVYQATKGSVGVANMSQTHTSSHCNM